MTPPRKTACDEPDANRRTPQMDDLTENFRPAALAMEAADPSTKEMVRSIAVMTRELRASLRQRLRGRLP